MIFIRSADNRETISIYFVCLYFLQCDDCDNLRNRLDSLEALVHKQAAVVHRQADVIKRLLQLDKEITNLRELHKKVNRRLVLGIYFCYTLALSETTKII